MKNELINFDKLTRDYWRELQLSSVPLLTEIELESITSLNDNINIQDVIDIYLPLINLIQIYKNNQENLSFSKGIFLKKEVIKRPFIIGISGSVAVGKSTTSRLLQLLLSRTFKDSKVEMVTTDGFLYPNEFLIKNNMLNKKGFPESYNMELLLDFLDAMKNGYDVNIPIYSHEIYDIIPNKKQTISSPDFLIVEGINVFQNPQNQRLYMTDFYDFAIYIDADSKDIEGWYLNRFNTLLKLAKEDKNNYYHRFTKLSEEDATNFAKNIWRTINLVNLEHYIEPTRNRADVILRKSKDHKINEIYLKK